MNLTTETTQVNTTKSLLDRRTVLGDTQSIKSLGYFTAFKKVEQYLNLQVQGVNAEAEEKKKQFNSIFNDFKFGCKDLCL